ncbi:helix-turn-helix transcriptional regulator [Nakamurella leprariae]|uniref:Uncharacterized protein n=1 Tax=Nakamurella leprariae TaxID=2803911 RepID=A0A939C1L6_9ACTN|nr:hypothetical protein [Nakamurella leprariae]MBM9467289.1 hypothetical protein [Nakamurella leprariae]
MLDAIQADARWPGSPEFTAETYDLPVAVVEFIAEHWRSETETWSVPAGDRAVKRRRRRETVGRVSKRRRVYLSEKDIAARVGLQAGTVRKYHSEGRLPEPAVSIGLDEATQVDGWTVEQVDAWQAGRPGKPGRPRKSPDA